MENPSEELEEPLNKEVIGYESAINDEKWIAATEKVHEWNMVKKAEVVKLQKKFMKGL